MLRNLRKIGPVLNLINFSKHSEFNRPNYSNFTNAIIFIDKRRLFCTNAVENIYNVDYDAITGGDSDLVKKLKVLMLEIEVMRQEGGRVPEKMDTERWIEILNSKTKGQRMRHLSFWWLNEKKRQHDKEKKEIRRLAREETSKDFTKEDSHIHYGFGGSTIFLRIYDTTMDRWKNWKLMEAMLFSQTLVIDCGYDKYMTNFEISNCAKQLLMLFADNRTHKDPFNLYFCNASRDNKLVMKLHKLLPTMYEPDFLFNITEKSFTDLFPKDKLVYLTPHCREELKNYEDDDIYIIGAMVDKVNNEPLSLGRAKAEGLRMAKFPLDRHLDWGVGTKSLTVNQSLNIMLDLRANGSDWNKAFSHVPRRKIKTEEEIEAEGNKRKKKYNLEREDRKTKYNVPFRKKLEINWN